MKRNFIFAITLVASSLLFNVANENYAFGVPKEGEILIESSNGADEGIFSEKDGLLEPNASKTKDFLIINNSNDNIKVKNFKFKNVALRNAENNEVYNEGSKKFKEFMKNCSLILSKDGKELFNGDLNKAFSKDGISLENAIKINNNKKEKMQLNFSISKDADNELQNLQNEFSLSITYELAENEDNNNNGNGGGNNGGNGNNLGGSNNTSGGNKPSIPNTGQLLGAGTLGVMGVGILSLGTFVLVKSKKKDGEKNE